MEAMDATGVGCLGCSAGDNVEELEGYSNRPDGSWEGICDSAHRGQDDGTGSRDGNDIYEMQGGGCDNPNCTECTPSFGCQATCGNSCHHKETGEATEEEVYTEEADEHECCGCCQNEVDYEEESEDYCISLSSKRDRVVTAASRHQNPPGDARRRLVDDEKRLQIELRHLHKRQQKLLAEKQKQQQQELHIDRARQKPTKFRQKPEWNGWQNDFEAMRAKPVEVYLRRIRSTSPHAGVAASEYREKLECMRKNLKPYVKEYRDKFRPEIQQQIIQDQKKKLCLLQQQLDRKPTWSRGGPLGSGSCASGRGGSARSGDILHDSGFQQPHYGQQRQVYSQRGSKKRSSRRQRSYRRSSSASRSNSNSSRSSSSSSRSHHSGRSHRSSRSCRSSRNNRNNRSHSKNRSRGSYSKYTRSPEIHPLNNSINTLPPPTPNALVLQQQLQQQQLMLQQMLLQQQLQQLQPVCGGNNGVFGSPALSAIPAVPNSQLDVQQELRLLDEIHKQLNMLEPHSQQQHQQQQQQQHQQQQQQQTHIQRDTPMLQETYQNNQGIDQRYIQQIPTMRNENAGFDIFGGFNKNNEGQVVEAQPPPVQHKMAPIYLTVEATTQPRNQIKPQTKLTAIPAVVVDGHTTGHGNLATNGCDSVASDGGGAGGDGNIHRNTGYGIDVDTKIIDNIASSPLLPHDLEYQLQQLQIKEKELLIQEEYLRAQLEGKKVEKNVQQNIQNEGIYSQKENNNVNIINTNLQRNSHKLRRRYA